MPHVSSHPVKSEGLSLTEDTRRITGVERVVIENRPDDWLPVPRAQSPHMDVKSSVKKVMY